MRVLGVYITMIARSCSYLTGYWLLLWSGSLVAHVSCKEALERLKEGNSRFAAEQPIHPNQMSAHREAVAKAQSPFAVILGCSDSRVPPEVIFDQGIGDLFIIRVAGNVVGPVEQESIGYAVSSLHSCLIVVLGHEQCGAVNAVLQGNTEGIPVIAKAISPSITKCTGEGLEAVVRCNVVRVVEQLKKSKKLKRLLKEGKVEIVGSLYHFDTGFVEFLSE